MNLFSAAKTFTNTFTNRLSRINSNASASPLPNIFCSSSLEAKINCQLCEENVGLGGGLQFYDLLFSQRFTFVKQFNYINAGN
jgi:hypothetical protein